MADEEAPVLSVESLRFTYRGRTAPALDDLTLRLDAGRWGLLLGPTGAGKSTLARCINRTIPRFFPGTLSGQVRVAGQDLGQMTVPQAARHVGMVVQEFETQIFTTSCLLEVAFAMESRCLPADRIRGKCRQLLASVGLAGFDERDPATLSGGEKQRLVLAAVMALEAPLLVLDEPGSDLDPEGRVSVYETIRSLEGQSVLLIEHDLEAVESEGPFFVLERGELSHRGTLGSAAEAIAAAPLLEAAGVRPAPLPLLLAGLGRKGALPGLPGRLTPDAVHERLSSAGWTFRRPDPAAGAARPLRAAAGEGLIRCERAGHRYPAEAGGRTALEAIDLQIGPGEMIAILGRNGSGKTTLARHMAGLLRPTSGRVFWKGRDVAGMAARERAAAVGYVFQDPDHQIFAPTVRDEVAFGPSNLGLSGDRLERRVGEALETAGLTGLEQEDPFALTKGERQRLALASVLACEPELLILDEPTTGLDRAQQAAVLSLLARLNAAGHTVVLITHALWLASERVDRLILMDSGRIVADGPASMLLTDAELLASTGLRMPDLARFSRLWEAPLLDLPGWVSALSPPPAAVLR